MSQQALRLSFALKEPIKPNIPNLPSPLADKKVPEIQDRKISAQNG